MGQFPVGGVTWSYLHYIKGFQRLGFEVFYLEDTGEWGFDPQIGQFLEDPSYATKYIHETLKKIGLEHAWTFIDSMGQYYGQTQQQVRKICQQAELLVNVSGGCWFARPEYEHLTKIFVDTDPGFHQMRIVHEAKMDKRKTGFESVRDFFASYDRLFTWGSNINGPTCQIAKTSFHWEPTLPPVVLDSWPVMVAHSTGPYTTLFSWRNNSFSDQEKSKSRGILSFLDLPQKISQRIVLALGGNAPLDLLRQHSWEVTDAIQTSLAPDVYQSFIQNSKAELGFAKSLYVESVGGWF